MAQSGLGEATGHGIGRRQDAQHALRPVAGEFEFGDPVPGLASALAVERIERISSSALPAGTMSAALLHDIGKLLLDARAGTTHRELLGRTHAAHAAVPHHAEMVRDFSQVEAEVFGAGHAADFMEPLNPEIRIEGGGNNLEIRNAGKQEAGV